MSGVYPKTDREYEVENAADTLIRAAKIKKDKKLLKAAKAELKKRADALKMVDSL